MKGGAGDVPTTAAISATTPGPPVANQFGKMKSEGCNVLVTGSVSSDVSYHATRTLLGDEKEPRTRVLACTDLVPEPDHYLRSGYDASPTTIVSRDVRRSASSMDAPRSQETLGSTPGQADRFERQIREAIVDARERENGLTPSQLRLAVLTLRPLVEALDCAETSRFIGALTEAVTDVRGMAHYHLPVEDDHELVERYGGLFDVRLEVRNREGIPAEMRWHLPPISHTTQWYPL